MESKDDDNVIPVPEIKSIASGVEENLKELWLSGSNQMERTNG